MVAGSAVSRGQIYAEQLAVAACAIAVWWLVAATLNADSVISSPPAVWDTLFGLIVSGEIWIHLRVTLYEALMGYLWGTLGGIAVGLLLGLRLFLSKVLEPLMTGLYALPKISFAPMLILFLGLEEPSKIALSAIIVFFFVFYSTFQGVRAVEGELLDAVSIMGASRRQSIRYLVLPSALEWVLDGLKIAVPSAFIGAIGGEIIISSRGLGYLIRESARTLDMDGVLAAIVVVVALSMAVNGGVNWGRARASRWRSDASAL